jgi:methylase of polypeptide subunit release factors
MQKLFGYLKNYSTIPFEIDRLIVSAYLKSKNLLPNNNTLLLGYIIKEEHTNEYDFLQDFLKRLGEETEEITLETIINLFEFVVSPADRIVNGAIYTPQHIRNYIIHNVLDHNEDLFNILLGDIACGCGSFLLTIARELHSRTGRTYEDIFVNSIYGLDIQDYSVTRTKLLLNLLALSEGEDLTEINFNIFTGDALTFDWHECIENFIGFSALVGNPPYVRYRNLDQQTRQNIKLWSTAQSGLTDLYIPFFQIGIENLRPNGILGFITMNSFFKSLNGRSLRQYFQEKLLDFVIEDFGAEQIFRSKNTYVCICFIYNHPANALRYASITQDDLNREIIHHPLPYHLLDSKTGWNLKNNYIISAIEKIGKPFGEIYKTRHGIATLKNDIYIFSPVAADDKFFYLQNGERFAIERGICKEIVNSNKLSRNKALDILKETVIFPYSHNGEKVEIMPEEMIKDLYPNAYRYLLYKKNILFQRDKGKGKDYENWYAYGRTQSLEKMTHKLFFPKFSDVTPSFLVDHDEDLMFYNGLALIGQSEFDVEIARKIMESKVFWYYIESTSKPYSNKYYSLNGNYINNFGVCDLSDDDKTFLRKETNKQLLDEFFGEKYEILI